MTNANLPPEIAERLAVFEKSVHEHWRLYTVEGIILIILGAAAIILPVIGSVAVEQLLGWLFLIGGIVGLTTTIMNRHAPGFWWSLLSAAAAVIAGVLLVGRPITGVISLTFVLTGFLAADGVLMILFAIEHRRKLSQRWGWLLVNGLLDLALAGIIAWALPYSAAWALGIIAGVDLLFGGFALIAVAMASK